MRAAIAMLLAAGCGFHPGGAAGGSDAPAPDAPPLPIDGPLVDGAPDAFMGGTCIGMFVQVCRDPAPGPGQDLMLATTQIDTDLDPRCVAQSQGQGLPDVCVLAAHDIHITGFVSAIGSRPLVLAAFHDFSIDGGGSVDVKSQRDRAAVGAGAGTAACATIGPAGSGATGAGGGAGGTFIGPAGAGGEGGTDGSGGTVAAQLTAPTALVGGCRGGDGADFLGGTGGAGGPGGGAVDLIAGHALAIHGYVAAGGAGGNVASNEAGGGGGGAGGMIVIDFDGAAINGTLAANGGGGASGGYFSNPGADTTPNLTPAAGGVSGVGAHAGWPGGEGATAAIGAFPGMNATLVGGGGGGGGGLGIIYMRGAADIMGTYSPAVTPLP